MVSAEFTNGPSGVVSRPAMVANLNPIKFFPARGRQHADGLRAARAMNSLPGREGAIQ